MKKEDNSYIKKTKELFFVISKDIIKSILIMLVLIFIYYMLFKEFTLFSIIFIFICWLTILYNSIYSIHVIDNKIYKNKNTVDFLNKITYNTNFYTTEYQIIESSLNNTKRGKYKTEFESKYRKSIELETLSKDERFNDYKKLNKNIFYQMFFDLFYLIIYEGKGEKNEQVNAIEEISSLFAKDHYQTKKLYETKYNFKKQGWVQQSMFIFILLFFSWATDSVWLMIIDNPFGKLSIYILIIGFLILDTIGSFKFRKTERIVK